MYSHKHSNMTIPLPEEISVLYTLEEIITIHNHCVVCTVICRKSKEKYILKILSKKYFFTPLYTQLKALSQDSFILPQKSYKIGHFHYLIYQKETTLLEYLLCHSLSFSFLYDFSFQIGHAILKLHSHHILHNDITIQNIYYNSSGKFYIGDFSSASFYPSSQIQFFFFSLLYKRTSTVASFLNCSEYGTISDRRNVDWFHFICLLYYLINENLSWTKTDLNPLESINSFLISSRDAILHQNFSEIAFVKKLDKLWIDSSNNPLCVNYSISLSNICDFARESTEPLSNVSSKNNSTAAKTKSLLPPLKHIFQTNKLFHMIPVFFCLFLFLFSLTSYLVTIFSRDDTTYNSPSTYKVAHPSTNFATDIFSSETSPYPSASTKKLQNSPCPSPTDNLHHTLDISQNIDKTKLYKKSDSIQILFANDCHLRNLSFLQNFPSLSELYCSNNDISALKNLSDCTHLKIAVFSKNKFTDVSSFSKCLSLTILDLSENRNLTHIQSLKSLSNLKYLILSNTNVSAKEICILQKSLPHCTILY